MDREFSIPWVGGQNTMGGGRSQNTMDRGSLYHAKGFNIHVPCIGVLYNFLYHG